MTALKPKPVAFTSTSGELIKVSDIICWRFLDGKPCLSAADRKLSGKIDVVIVPIVYHNSKGQSEATDAATAEAVQQHCKKVHDILTAAGISALLDDDQRKTPGCKFHLWEHRGIPLRLEVGPREVREQSVCMSIHKTYRGAAELLLSHPSALTNPTLSLLRSAAFGLCCLQYEGATAACENIRKRNEYNGSQDEQTSLQSVAVFEEKETASIDAYSDCQEASLQLEVEHNTRLIGGGSLHVKLRDPYNNAQGIEFQTLRTQPASELEAALSKANPLVQDLASPAEGKESSVDSINPVVTEALPRARSKLSGLPLACIVQGCERLLHAFQGASRRHPWQPVSPHFCGSSPQETYHACTKLHLWTSEPCFHCLPHLRYLLHMGKPCHCGVGHLSLEELKVEVEMAYIEAQEHHVLSWHNDDGYSGDGAVTLFVGDISLALLVQDVTAELGEGFRSYGASKVICSRNGSGGTTRGWARVMVPDKEAAASAVKELDGRLTVGGKPVRVSFSCGRCDTLFPALPYSLRAQLRVDPVGAYSVTDSITAAQMTEVIATIASAAYDTQPDETSGLMPLALLDGTACCGGNTISFLSRFATVHAAELDEDRLLDLAHNLRVLGHKPTISAPSFPQSLHGPTTLSVTISPHVLTTTAPSAMHTPHAPALIAPLAASNSYVATTVDLSVAHFPHASTIVSPSSTNTHHQATMIASSPPLEMQHIIASSIPPFSENLHTLNPIMPSTSLTVSFISPPDDPYVTHTSTGPSHSTTAVTLTTPDPVVSSSPPQAPPLGSLLSPPSVSLYCGDLLHWVQHIPQHVVFLDPPWGGPQYASSLASNGSGPRTPAVPSPKAGLSQLSTEQFAESCGRTDVSDLTVQSRSLQPTGADDASFDDRDLVEKSRSEQSNMASASYNGCVNGFNHSKDAQHTAYQETSTSSRTHEDRPDSPSAHGEALESSDPGNSQKLPAVRIRSARGKERGISDLEFGKVPLTLLVAWLLGRVATGTQQGAAVVSLKLPRTVDLEVFTARVMELALGEDENEDETESEDSPSASEHSRSSHQGKESTSNGLENGRVPPSSTSHKADSSAELEIPELRLPSRAFAVQAYRCVLGRSRLLTFVSCNTHEDKEMRTRVVRALKVLNTKLPKQGRVAAFEASRDGFKDV